MENCLGILESVRILSDWFLLLVQYANSTVINLDEDVITAKAEYIGIGPWPRRQLDRRLVAV